MAYYIEMDFSKAQRLGGKAFLFFLSKRSKLPVLLLAVIIVWWTQQDRLSPQYLYLSNYALKLAILLWVAFTAFKLLRTYFEYRGYEYRFDDEFFQITRGYITKQEIGVVYHQIQNVTLRRGMMDRISGVSHLIIMMAGHPDQRQAQVVLPALNKEIARLIQKELLREARRHAVGAYIPPPTPIVAEAEAADVEVGVEEAEPESEEV